MGKIKIEMCRFVEKTKCSNNIAAFSRILSEKFYFIIRMLIGEVFTAPIERQVRN